tara:strand:- start:111 stop:419 length:309 start_codon:yes stop_codon:yes gene_type:complete
VLRIRIWLTVLREELEGWRKADEEREGEEKSASTSSQTGTYVNIDDMANTEVATRRTNRQVKKAKEKKESTVGKRNRAIAKRRVPANIWYVSYACTSTRRRN